MRKRCRSRLLSRLLLDNYLTRETLAHELGVCERTIARYERDLLNPLPFTKIGGRKEYQRALVEEWLVRRGQRHNPRTKPKPRKLRQPQKKPKH